MSGEGASNAFDDYSKNVLGGGDGKSHATKSAVDIANESTSNGINSLLTGKDGEIRLGDYILSMGTDGVGTKIQIYMRQYENYFKQYDSTDKGEYDYKIIMKKTVELCDRMLADLTAMLFDDGIKGERSIAFTDIIDTNTTDGDRADIFFKAFKVSLGNSIINNDSLNLNGETANLGENGKLVRALEFYNQSLEVAKKEINEKRKQISMAKKLEGSGKLIQSIKGGISIIINEVRDASNKIKDLLNELELNLAGSFLGIKSAIEEDEKMVEMEEGDIIIGLSETKTEDGIISPRSNGLTLIRKLSKELLGDNWENQTFEDYLSAIGDKASQIPDILKEKLAGLKMWDIATGKTTIFNKFIADDLLGGTKGQPIAKISGLRHGTGNPLFKLYSGLMGRTDLMFDVDISNLEVPDIILLLQVAFDIDDKTAAEPFNMGLPYTIICKPGEEEKILEQAVKSGITANVIGKVNKKQKEDPAIRVKGVGLGNSEITYDKKTT